MSDMTRHDIYGHELDEIEFFVNAAAEATDPAVRDRALNEIRSTCAGIRKTDAGPLPRGEHITKAYMVNAIVCGLRAEFDQVQHVEIRELDKSTVQVFVRPKDSSVYDFVIKVSQPR